MQFPNSILRLVFVHLKRLEVHKFQVMVHTLTEGRIRVGTRAEAGVVVKAVTGTRECAHASFYHLLAIFSFWQQMMGSLILAILIVSFPRMKARTRTG